jgi:hypothetical protein
MKQKHTNDCLGRRGRHLGVAGAVTATVLAGSVPALVAAVGSVHDSAVLDTRLVAGADDLPNRPAYELPGEESGPPTNFHQAGFPPYVGSTRGDFPFQVTDNDGNVVGTYDVHGSIDNFFLTISEEYQVYDSTGMAPADGTIYGVFHAGGVINGISNYYVTGPAGTQDLFESADIRNYFSSTPDGGLFDTLYLFGTRIPIIDIPAPDGTDSADVGDVGALSSDVAAPF